MRFKIHIISTIVFQLVLQTLCISSDNVSTHMYDISEETVTLSSSTRVVQPDTTTVSATLNHSDIFTTNSIDKLSTSQVVATLNQTETVLNITSLKKLTEKIKVSNNICSHANSCICYATTNQVSINCSGTNLTVTRDNRNFSVNLNYLSPVSNLHLRFDENQIEFIPTLPSMLVVSLNLSHNLISDINFKAFDNLKSLEILDLSYNKLKSYEFIGWGDERAGYIALKLQHLNLSHNQIHYVQAPSFAYLKNLKSLDLSHNPLSINDGVTYFSIGELRYLERLNLASTALTSIRKDIFLELPQLAELDLSDNFLENEPNQFQHATCLKLLTLQNNRHRFFDEFSFLGLDNLEILSLKNSSYITVVDYKAFKNMTSLKMLDLSYCSRFRKLTDSTNRRLDSFETNKELSRRNINTILLNNNAISMINENDFPWDRFDNINIINNPFNCSCGVSWILRNVLSKIQWNGTDLAKNLTCAHPEDLRGRPLKELYWMPGIFSNCSLKNKSTISCPDIHLIFGLIGTLVLLGVK